MSGEGTGLRGLEAQPLWVRLVPALGLALLGLALLLLQPARIAPTLGLVAAYLVTPLGPEAWLVAARAAFGFSVPQAVLVLLWVSAVQALLFGVGLHAEALVVRLPRLGAKVRRLEERIRAKPRAQRNVALALFAAVLLPIHSGGAILASLAGRILGLSGWRTVAAVLGAVALRFTVAAALLTGILSLTRP